MSLLRLEPRHTKGFLTLTLFVLAESVTFSNAVSFWSKFQQQQSQHKNTGDSSFFEQHQQQTKSSSFFAPRSQILPQEDSSCDATATKPLATTASSSTSRKALGRSGGILKQWMMGGGNSGNTRSDPSYCCSKCTGCMEDSTVAGKVASLCRGGHGIHSHDSHPIDAIVSTVTPFNLPLNAWKVIFQFFLTALNVACWLIPLKSKKISENKLGLSLANAFSGGVFLSLAFGHLIPECVHGFEAYNEATPFLLVLAGYLLIFFIEKVAFDAHDILHEMADHDHHSHAAPRGGHVGGHSSSTANGAAAAPPSAGSSGRSAVILLGALAVHSILEMMALGLSNSFSDCALLTLSISLHQPAESIALLVAFLKSGLSHGQIIRFLSIFSCMGPIGVLLGMLVNEYAAPIVDSIMLAIVAGTFVYVGATEVIPEEWEDSTHKWKKFLALMSGIVSILAITQYTMTLGH